MKEIISLNDVNKSFGSQTVLENVTLTIEQGDFVVIMGPSGSGKTTLVNILSFLETADSGKYSFLGKDVTHTTIEERSQYRREQMNIVFQKFNLFDELTVYENLASYLKLCQLFVDNSDEMIRKITDSFGLAEHLHKKVSVLSQGEKQRVAISRSFLAEKQLIIADEPTASVDSNNRNLILKQLVEAQKSGKTVIAVTHDSEYLKYATRIFNIKYGRVSEQQKKGGNF